MLRQGIKLIVIVLLVFNSCCDPSKKLDISNQKLEWLVNSKFYGSSPLHKDITDTIQHWVELKLGIVKPFIFSNWQVDKLIIFNEDSTRLVTSIYSEPFALNASLAEAYYFYGAKIGLDWYYYSPRQSTVLPHIWYQDSMYAPFTFEELTYLSHTKVLKGALIKKPDGTLSPKESFFNRFYFYPKPHDLKEEPSKELSESIILNWIKGYHKGKISTEEYAYIKKTISESVRPPEPPLDPDRPIKIFESEAWKNRYKKEIQNN